MQKNAEVVTRFAPSPTGFMHVGGVRTALYAWLYARKNNGKFILRIEDTDKEREVAGSIEHIQKSLKWLGLDWDEGPFIQSERLEIYKKYAQKLIDKGIAVEEEGALWFKFKKPKKTQWHDLAWGDLSAGPEAQEDFVLIKSDGYPTYNFAHIVDDIEMGVTHVVRGQEFISSVPKYLALYEALEVAPPHFITTPPIMAPDGKKKLSKRDGAKDVLEYAEEGYLPDAMINYLAFLGFNPGGDKEVYTRAELIQAFDLAKIQHSGASWNEAKLNWFNKEHMKLLPKEMIQEEIFKKLPENLHNPKLIPIILERIAKWSDVDKMLENGELEFFASEPAVLKEKLVYKNTPAEKISENIKEAIEKLDELSEDNFSEENIKAVLMAIANQKESRGEVLHPVRYALSGLERSPDPFIIASILGKNETLSRLEKVI